MLDLAYVNFVLRVWLYWASRFRILIKQAYCDVDCAILLH